MAEDYEDIYDIESMTDEEIGQLVRDQLEQHPDIDPARIDLAVNDGRVTVSGRVGTEGEAQVIEHVLTDVIGVPDVSNEIVVDELVRQQHADAADEANAEVYARNAGGSGGANRTEDSAEHLLDDTAAEQFGTDSVEESVERGQSYNPPDRPVQGGN